MLKERILLIAIWLVSIAVTVLFVSKAKRREAALSFLACQCLTWINSLLRVKFHLLVFPVREFPKATDLLVSTEFFMYPLICAFYYIYDPKSSSVFRRFIHLCIWTTGADLVEVLLEKYTNLITYLHFTWYWTWLDFFVLFIVTNVYCNWFFKKTGNGRAPE
jgi:hypothetical protein